MITRPRNTEFIVSPQKEQAALQGLIKLCSKLYEDEDASKKGKENKRKVKENLKREKIMGIPREEAKVEKQAEVSSIKEPETKSAPIVATGLPSLQKISEESKVQSMGPNLPPMQMFSNNALYNPALLYSSLFMNHPLSQSTISNYLLMQKDQIKPGILQAKPQFIAEKEEEKKVVPFKRQTMHVGIAHFIARSKKHNIPENSSTSQPPPYQGIPNMDTKQMPMGYTQPTELPYTVMDILAAQQLLRSIQEVNNKELFDKGFL